MMKTVQRLGNFFRKMFEELHKNENMRNAGVCSLLKYKGITYVVGIKQHTLTETPNAKG